MKKQYGRILAVLMAVAMVLSMFTFTVFATGDDTVADTDIVATMDEATADEATEDETTADEATEDEATIDETTQDEPVIDTTVDEATDDETLGLLGDTNGDGKISIQDATLIQKYLADLASFDEVQLILANSNGDAKISVQDATEIQKHLADLPSNELIGTPVNGTVTDDETTEDEVATDDEVIATDDEVATEDEIATDDEVIATDDEVATPDEPTTDEATEDEVATPDEPVVETKYYIVGFINNTDIDSFDYELVDGTVTIEITSPSYFAVMDEYGVIYWTNGWLDFNPTSAVMGEFGSNNNKFHVAEGTVTVTWDAETFTLTKV